jgi:hypothetical protein
LIWEQLAAMSPLLDGRHAARPLSEKILGHWGDYEANMGHHHWNHDVHASR